MQKFKINDESTNKVIEAYDRAIQNEVVFDTIDKIKALVSNEKFSSRMGEIRDYHLPTFIGKNIVISEPSAFTEEEINKFTEIDKEFSDILDAIKFELRSLNRQKEKAINDYDIVYAVKLADKIMELGVRLADEESKINKYNNEIKDLELEFSVKYNNLVSDMEDEAIVNIKSDIFEGYDDNVVKAYIINRLSGIVSDSTDTLTDEDRQKILTSKELSDYLGESVIVANKVKDNVGTDN